MDLTGVVMYIDDVEYSAKQVVQFGRIGPSIEVTLFDLIKLSANGGQKAVVEFSKNVPELDNGEIIVFKKDGSFLILTGKNKLADIALHQMPDKIFKVRLLSSHGLKKTKIVERVPETIVVPIKTYDTAFANRPYIAKPVFVKTGGFVPEPRVTYKGSKY